LPAEAMDESLSRAAAAAARHVAHSSTDDAVLSGNSLKVPWIMGGAVSLYFRDAFMVLWKKGMGADFKDLTAMYPEYDVWVTGHSLGAALATLAASYVVAACHVPSSKVFVITFGQPRVGDYRFARAYEEKMGYSFRVTHWRDWVPHVLPEKFFNYYHHSPEARLSFSGNTCHR
ncbi:triacylglycerol lipase, partial [Teladorsagia circumcincta]